MTATTNCCEETRAIAAVLADTLNTTEMLSTRTVADGLFAIAEAIRMHTEATRPRRCPVCGETIAGR